MPKEKIEFEINQPEKLAIKYQKPLYRSKEESQYNRESWGYTVEAEGKELMWWIDERDAAVVSYLVSQISPGDEIEVTYRVPKGEKYGHYEVDGINPAEMKDLPEPPRNGEGGSQRGGVSDKSDTRSAYSEEDRRAFAVKDAALQAESCLRSAVLVIQAEAQVDAARIAAGEDIGYSGKENLVARAVALAADFWEFVEGRKDNSKSIAEQVKGEVKEAFGNGKKALVPFPGEEDPTEPKNGQGKPHPLVQVREAMKEAGLEEGMLVIFANQKYREQKGEEWTDIVGLGELSPTALKTLLEKLQGEKREEFVKEVAEVCRINAQGGEA